MATITRTITEQTTWGELQALVNEGLAAELNIGTVVTDTLKDGREMPYVLVAVNHYQESELIFANAVNYDGSHCMNKSGTNKGGWNASDLRKYANEKILDLLLPDDMAAVIAPRTIVEVENDGKRVESTDKLWCFSAKEVCGDWLWDNDNGEDKQMPYFKIGKNRILRDIDDELVCSWWERSPHRNYSGIFYYVSTSGYPGSNSDAYTSLGVCLGFAIRKSK